MMGLGVGGLEGYDEGLTLSFGSVFVKRVHANNQTVRKQSQGYRHSDNFTMFRFI